jgi:predicted AlkP superfamily phosphohydrolase/phosphomutase
MELPVFHGFRSPSANCTRGYNPSPLRGGAAPALAGNRLGVWVRTRANNLLAVLFALMPCAFAFGCSKKDEHPKQAIVLGFDGLDPKLCTEMIEAGKLPAMAALARSGGFQPLATSIPPQSPVAWSSLITGTNPGTHGIFDFIHRDPDTYMPYESTAQEGEKGWPLELGKYEFDLWPSGVKNRRHSKPFWEYLTEAGIPAHVYRMPANYPPAESKGAYYCCLSDMGTPDLRGTNGEFTVYYTPSAFRRMGGGGSSHRVRFLKQEARTWFFGPPDLTLKPVVRSGQVLPPKRTETPLTIYRDPERPTIRLVWDDQDVLISKGEWSDWFPVEFKMGPQVTVPLSDGATTPIIPGTTVVGICRFYLKEVHPDLILYVTPINVDPLAPALPISQPDDFVTAVAKKIGRHYTQGLAEDTKALTHEVLNRDEFLQQAQIVLDERCRMLDYALDHFAGGLLYFYFGSSDQIAHMFWGARFAGHPALSEEEHEKYQHVVEGVYEQLDLEVAKVVKRFPKATVLVISDHGFETWTRAFNLNTWLLEKGYAVMSDPTGWGASLNFDWTRTRAYALGINGLYINVQGRERDGIVPASEKQALMDDIAAKLVEFRDPESGKQVVKRVYDCAKVFGGTNLSIGPDMIVGYDRTFRGSNATALGKFPLEVMEDNKDDWCADHCIAAELVPGVVFTNRRQELDSPTLEDIAPTILAEFGLPIPQQMHKRNLFSAPQQVAGVGKE